MVQYSQSYSEKEGNFSIIEFSPSKETPLNDQLIDYHTMLFILMTGFALIICLSMSAPTVQTSGQTETFSQLIKMVNCQNKVVSHLIIFPMMVNSGGLLFTVGVNTA